VRAKAAAAAEASRLALARQKASSEFFVSPEFGDQNKYAPIIAEVLEFADGEPEPEFALMEIMKLLTGEYRRRKFGV
jgi:hypothetical protein